MPNIIITKGTYDKFLSLRPVFKHLLDAFLAENSIQIVYNLPISPSVSIDKLDLDQISGRSSWYSEKK